MNSASRSCHLPGFEIDPETGRYYPVPVDFAAVFGYGKKRSKPTWSFPISTQKDEDPPSKIRKIESGVRKELFKRLTKIPIAEDAELEIKETKAKPKACKSLAKMLPSTTGRSSFSAKKKMITPMITISEGTESESHQAAKATITNGDRVRTPDSRDTKMLEFLQLEQQFKTPKLVNDSPVSSVCNMFQSKMLLDKEENRYQIIADIKKVIEQDRMLCLDTATKIQAIKLQQEQHEANLVRLATIVQKLDDDYKSGKGKENSSSAKRRSMRLQYKQSAGGTPKGSPAILKAGDLRKEAMTKSLAQKIPIDSPTIKKAMDLYNSTRRTCSALVTPKLSRSQVRGSPMSSLRNNLSVKVQQQCLMLTQQTPAKSK